jgi:hypothetical protein
MNIATTLEGKILKLEHVTDMNIDALYHLVLKCVSSRQKHTFTAEIIDVFFNDCADIEKLKHYAEQHVIIRVNLQGECKFISRYDQQTATVKLYIHIIDTANTLYIRSI